MFRVTRLTIAAMFAALWCQPAQMNRVRREANIRMDVNLILVPVTVTDRRGATVTGLDRRQFQVFENKVEQPIVTFTQEDSPVSVGVIFDLSGSMKNKVEEARRSSAALFKKASADDEAFLITFSTHPESPTGFTSDFEVIQAGIGRKAGGSTALVDAVYLALNRMRNAHNARRALVVISDGMDNHSRYTRPELLTLAKEADVQIYSIALFDPSGPRKAIELAQERKGVALLEDLSRVSGGLHFSINATADIPPVAEKIGTALHNVYVIGYHPRGGMEGFRKIQVKATIPNVRLATRPGYYAAPSGSLPPREERLMRP